MGTGSKFERIISVYWKSFTVGMFLLSLCILSIGFQPGQGRRRLPRESRPKNKGSRSSHRKSGQRFAGFTSAELNDKHVIYGNSNYKKERELSAARSRKNLFKLLESKKANGTKMAPSVEKVTKPQKDRTRYRANRNCTGGYGCRFEGKRCAFCKEK